MNDSIQEIIGINIQKLETRIIQENIKKKAILQEIVSLFENLSDFLVYQKTNLEVFHNLQNSIKEIPEDDKPKIIDLLSKYKGQVDLNGFRLWSAVEKLLDQIRIEDSTLENDPDPILFEVVQTKKFKNSVRQEIKRLSRNGV